MHINLPDKRYYKIGEIAKAFNVNASLIRFWDKEFEVIQPKKKCERQPDVYARGCKKFTNDLSFGKRKRIYLRWGSPKIKTESRKIQE